MKKVRISVWYELVQIEQKICFFLRPYVSREVKLGKFCLKFTTVERPRLQQLTLKFKKKAVEGVVDDITRAEELH